VRLTPSGRRAFDAMAPAHEAWVVDMMSGLEGQEMSELLELLGRLRSVLDHPQTDQGQT